MCVIDGELMINYLGFLKNVVKFFLSISVLLNWDKGIKDFLCLKFKFLIKFLMWLYLVDLVLKYYKVGVNKIVERF